MYLARFDERKGWRIVFTSDDITLDICGAVSELVAHETAAELTRLRNGLYTALADLGPNALADQHVA